MSLKKTQDHLKQISQAQSFHRRSAIIHASKASEILTQPFTDAVGRIETAVHEYEAEDHSVRDRFLNRMPSLFNAVRFHETLPRDFPLAVEKIVASIFEYHNEQLDAIFSGKPFEGVSNKYRQTDEQWSLLYTDSKSAVLNHFSAVIAEAKEVEQSRIWLQGNFHSMVTAATDDIDWVYLAGRLEEGNEMHPAVSDSLRIGRLLRESINGMPERAVVAHYIDRFNTFQSQVFDSLFIHQWVPATEQIKTYVFEKFVELNCVSIATALSALAAEGYDLTHYFMSLDFDELEKAEQILHNKETAN